MLNEFPIHIDDSWLAMQYSLGELSADDCETFELRMLNEPALCDTLVSVMQMRAAVTAASRTTVGSVTVAIGSIGSPQPKSRLMSVQSFSVASACLAVAVLFGVMLFEFDGRQSVGDDEAAAFARLVTDELSVGDSEDSLDDVSSDDPLNELLAPEWLVTAIELDEAAANGTRESDPDDETELF